ncbi:MAG: hypothetical protein WAU42_00045 [Solirubrobacteraceae bacterium]
MSRPPRYEEFDVVASSFDAWILTHVGKNRMQSILDMQTIGIRVYIVGAAEA